MIIVPYWIKIKDGTSLFEYNGRCYSTMREMIQKILHHRQINNVREVCLYNVGFMKGNKVTRTRVTFCESVLPFLDSRYRYLEYDVEKNANLYNCGRITSKNFETILQISLKSKCYIRINAPMFIGIHSSSNVKPIISPKFFCVYTPFGKHYYKRNPVFDYVWKEVWSNCKNDCYFFRNFKKTKINYWKELNRYRRACGKSFLVLHPILDALAQKRANNMAKYNTLIADENKKYDELIAYSTQAYGMFLIKILFEDAWSHNPDFDRKSARKREMARLMSSNQKYVGIGIAKKGNYVYVCMKFTSFKMYENILHGKYE
uniref:SCP domain-containing protein n=1 Tax=Strongyloides venezuelensis TaxID=75913 RepID=A0A0K0FIY1_STRVS